MTESSGTHDYGWGPRKWPSEAGASEVLKEWVRHPESTFYALDVDFRGSDLSGVNFTEAWLSGSDFSEVGLRDAILWRAHCEDVKFNGADLREADLAKAHLDRADFSKAFMGGASLRRVECSAASFTCADMRRATLDDAIFMQADLTGADLSEASVVVTAFHDTKLVDARVAGMTGTILGSLTVRDVGVVVALSGPRLEDWFRRNGADVSVRDQ